MRVLGSEQGGAAGSGAGAVAVEVPVEVLKMCIEATGFATNDV